MKKMVIAGALALATVTGAGAAEVSPSIAAERDTKAEVNRVKVGSEITKLPYGIESEVMLSFADSNDDLKFSGEKLEFDISKKMYDKFDLYMENDFDKDFERTETTVGVKYKW